MQLDEHSLLQAAASAVGVVGWQFHVATGEVEWSAGAGKALGHDADDLTYRDVLRMITGRGRQRLRDAIRRCITARQPFDMEVAVRVDGPDPRWVRITGSAVVDTNGWTTHVRGAVLDLTPLRKGGLTAGQPSGQLATALEQISDAFYTFDREWRFTYLNRRAAELLGRDRSELLGQVGHEVFPEVLGTPFALAYRQAAQRRTSVVVSGYYPPLGRSFEARAHPTDEGVAVYFNDITDRLASEEALRERQTLLEHAEEAIFAIDSDRRITYWNTAASRTWRCTPEDLPADIGVAALLPDPSALDDILEVVRTRGIWTGELSRHDDDGEEIVLESRWTRVADDDERPETASSVLVLTTDVTERRRLERQAVHAQRLESLGTLAGGIAHDLNNVLTPILMAVELLAVDERDSRRAELLEMARANTQRGAEMVRQILTFAGRVEGARELVPVRALLAEIHRMVRDTFPKQIEVQLAVSDDDLVVLGDRTQLHQVLLNLTVNARDAMPTGGRLSMAADAVDLVAPVEVNSCVLAPGPHVRLRIDDTGEGMSPALVERIFDPFFTTKGVDKGTGLGLSTSLTLVRSHGGALQVSSTQGVGTTMDVLLPRVTERGPAEPFPDAPPEGNGETVLLVDDEAQVRTSARRTLERFGYRVIPAADGTAAVGLLAQGIQVDAAVVDLLMPGLDGPETIRVMRAMRPDLPIVAASGMDDRGLVARAEDAGATGFIAKPYAAADLLRILRHALASPR